MKALPGGVKCGAWEYKIEEYPPDDADADGNYGRTLKTVQIIKVDLRYGWKRAASTLLHELLHVSVYHSNAHENDTEEQLIFKLEQQLTAMWVDSPEVFDWIGKGLTSGD